MDLNYILPTLKDVLPRLNKLKRVSKKADLCKEVLNTLFDDFVIKTSEERNESFVEKQNFQHGINKKNCDTFFHRYGQINVKRSKLSRALQLIFDKHKHHFEFHKGLISSDFALNFVQADIEPLVSYSDLESSKTNTKIKAKNSEFRRKVVISENITIEKALENDQYLENSDFVIRSFYQDLHALRSRLESEYSQ